MLLTNFKNKLIKLLKNKIILKPLNYKNNKKNIYKVKWGRIWSSLNDGYINRVIIQDLKLEYCPIFNVDISFNKYVSVISFYSHDKVYTKEIEINDQLKELLYSKDKLNRILGTQIIFQKLGINYE